MWRHRDGRSLYRSYRDPETGKVRQRYLGQGQFWQKLAELDQQWEEACRKERDFLLLLEQWDVEDFGERVAAVFDHAQQVATASLWVTGHHRKKGSQWRRIKQKREDNMSTASLAPPEKYSYEQKLDALQRGQKGDMEAMPILRHIAQSAYSREMMGGTPARLRQEIREYCYPDGSLLQRAALEEEALQQRAALLGSKPSPLERVLADSIVTSQCYHDGLLNKLVSERTMDRRLRLTIERQVSEASKRLLASIRMLATIRRLQIPQQVVQLNVASRQQIVGSANATSPTPKPRRRARKTITAEPAQTPTPAIGQAPNEEKN